MLKTILAAVIAAAFLISVPVHAEEKAPTPAGDKTDAEKKDKAKKAKKTDGTKADKPAGGW